MCHLACAKGSLNILKYLIKKGADVNIKNNHLDCLMIACQHGRMRVIKYLIQELKFSPETMNIKSRRAIHFAAFWGHTATVKYLVEECGAIVNAPDMYCDDALSLAIKKRRTETALYLVSIDVFDYTESI